MRMTLLEVNIPSGLCYQVPDLSLLLKVVLRLSRVFLIAKLIRSVNSRVSRIHPCRSNASMEAHVEEVASDH